MLLRTLTENAVKLGQTQNKYKATITTHATNSTQNKYEITQPTKQQTIWP